MRLPLVPFVFAFAIPLAGAGAQFSPAATGPVPSQFAKDYKVDFAIPDAPAFKLLEVSQGAILRPQTAQALSLALANIRGDGGQFVVPKEFGIEVSPALLAAGQGLDLKSYVKGRLFYNTRLSAATKRDSAGRSQLAAGIRVSLTDEQNARDTTFIQRANELTGLTRKMLDIYNVALDRSTVAERDAPGFKPKLTAADSGALDSLKVQTMRLWEEGKWNARSLDIALAARATSVDSLGHDPQIEHIALWATYGQPIGSTQLLIGLQSATQQDSTGEFVRSNTIGFRWYFGSNKAKVFLEYQNAVTSGATNASTLLNSGAELRIPNLGWIVANAGVQTGKSGRRPVTVASFKISTQIPGLQ